MNPRKLETVFGLVVLVITTVMSTGPSYVLGASIGGDQCLDCNGGNTPECRYAEGASSGCKSTEIVSDCTGGGELTGICMDDELNPPSSECHDGCNVDNEYCETDPDEW